MPAASPLMGTHWVRHRVARAESAETSLGTAGTGPEGTPCATAGRRGRRPRTRGSAPPSMVHSPSMGGKGRGIMLVVGAQHRLGDGEIVPAVGNLGIDCQGALVLRHGFRGTVGVEKNLAAVEVDDGKVGVEPFGDGQGVGGSRR